MPKKISKKHSHTHNENKNHIHIHIGDKKRKSKGKRRRQGNGGGRGGGTSIQSIVNPPNIVIPQYNKPQYFDPTTMAGRERANEFGFSVPNIKHNQPQIPAGFTTQEAGINTQEFSMQNPMTSGSIRHFTPQVPVTNTAEEAKKEIEEMKSYKFKIPRPRIPLQSTSTPSSSSLTQHDLRPNPSAAAAAAAGAEAVESQTRYTAQTRPDGYTEVRKGKVKFWDKSTRGWKQEKKPPFK